MSGEQFSLVWNTFPRNLSSGLYNLLTGEQLVDVTLAAEGQILRAHKLILSVCSTYFRDLFKGNTCKHPIVILKDVNYRDLSAMLHFMYQGEVNIKQEDIASFLKVAEILQIKGLTKNNDDDESEKHTDLSEFVEPMDDGEKSNHEESSEKNPTHNPCCCQSEQKKQSNVPERDSLLEGFQEDSESEIEGILKDSDEISIKDCPIDSKPLDCTKAIDNADVALPEYKPGISLTETRRLSTDSGVPTQQNPSDEQEVMDLVLNPQMQYDSPYQNEPQSSNYNAGATYQSEILQDSASGSRGRRTVKGIPSSSLSLETTLRVISELGPTLRMERGKVIRMYSCPWCLRHFTRKENLKLHVRYIHGPLESLTCKLCGNKYKNSNSLRVHSYLYHNAKRNKPNKSVVGGSA